MSELEIIEGIDQIIRLWLDDGDITIFCGAWSNGAIMELLPRGRARLTGPRYVGQFAGLRDLLLDDGAHHVHLDLGRLSQAHYLVGPSVCYGFAPSFELRIAARGVDPLREFGLGLAVRQPYDGTRLHETSVTRYFTRVAEHLRTYPDIASLTFNRPALSPQHDANWFAIEQVLSADPNLQHLRARLPEATSGA